MKTLLTISALFLSATALAQQPQAPQAPQAAGEEESHLPGFTDIDANEDLQLSRDEIADMSEDESVAEETSEALAALDFGDADTNRDGYLSRQEYTEVVEKDSQASQ